MTKLIGNEEAAKLLDVSVDTLRRICADVKQLGRV